MVYGSAVWHTPKISLKINVFHEQTHRLQKKCLRTIAGVRTATPILVPEAETFMAPIDAHLDQLQARGRYRLRAGGQAKFVAAACKTIERNHEAKPDANAYNNQPRAFKNTTGPKNLLIHPCIVPVPDPCPPWSHEAPAIHHGKVEAAKAAQHER